jgi:hypothetical protein
LENPFAGIHEFGAASVGLGDFDIGQGDFDIGLGDFDLETGAESTEFRRFGMACVKDDLRGKMNCDGLPFVFLT